MEFSFVNMVVIIIYNNTKINGYSGSSKRLLLSTILIITCSQLPGQQWQINKLRLHILPTIELVPLTNNNLIRSKQIYFPVHKLQIITTEAM